MKWNPRLHNRYFWVAMFSLIALTGKVWGLYDVPEGWNIWVDAVLALLTAVGVIVNPTTDGFKD